MPYKYYISYQFNKGFGCQEVIMDTPITEFKQVKEIAEMISDARECGEVVILFYTRLGEN